MNKSPPILLLLTALLLGVTGSDVVEAQIAGSPEAQFEGSPAGIEATSMGKTCLSMKITGLLPGIEAIDDAPFTLKTEGIKISKINDVTYPYKLNCVVTMNGQEHSFPFIKQSPKSDWRLS